MVVIIILTGIIGLITGYAAYQWQELRRADKRVADLLDQIDLRDVEINVTRMVLDLAVRKNAQLKRDNLDHEASLLLVLGELERVS